MNIKLLDCTLRDGGHINQSDFGEYAIKSILSNLAETKVDIVEIGFLKNCEYDVNKALFPNVSYVKEILPFRGNSKYALMLQEDQYDWNQLEKNDGTIEFIRVSFHNYDFEQGLECCKEVIKKGYKCFINPINLPGYSDREIIDIVDQVNRINPYAFTIVDTFGVLKKNDLSRIYQLIENNLDKDISIGIHLHENLSLAYSLAQNFIEMKAPSRSIVIDGSLYGMGRVPGNLCIELIMDYLNETMETQYRNEYAFDAIDEFIEPIKKKHPWGYSSAYALSAQFHMHRSYAEYLLSKNRLNTKDIKRILESVKEEDRAVYKQEVIEKKYIDFNANDIDDKDSMRNLRNIMTFYNSFLILAPGSTIIQYKEKIQKFISEKKPCVISVNFIPEEMDCDFHFFSNIKRYKQSCAEQKENILCSSNLQEKAQNYRYMFDYRKLVFFDDVFSENSTLMLFNLLERMKIKKNVYCAGFDGFKENNNFWNDAYNREVDCYKENGKVTTALMCLKKILNIQTLTPTIYDIDLLR